MMADYEVGQKVKICSHWPPSPPTHCRTPHYIRGCLGTIERYCGDFENPEELAFGRKNGRKLALYRVRFLQKDVWKGYEGNLNDRIEIEIYETWLEKV
mgnify:CR=1 FL=1|tara:strand:+ start:992 stop:1285 length:294 start_codon:yes stop_codon:yes gene_type:complete